MTVRIIARTTLIAGILLIFAAGCTSLPEPTGDTGVLVIPVRHRNDTDRGYFGKYRVSVETPWERESWRGVRASDDMLVVTGLRPGLYTLKTQFWYDSSSVIGTEHTSSSSRVETDRITINAFYLEVSMEYNDEREEYVMRATWLRTTPEIREETKSRLSNYPNYGLWSMDG